MRMRVGRIKVAKEDEFWVVFEPTDNFVRDVSGFRFILHYTDTFPQAWDFVNDYLFPHED